MRRKIFSIVRKANDCPAVFHLVDTAEAVRSICADEDVIYAAVLHDAAEDDGVQLSEIGMLFGERVMQLAGYKTENSFQTLTSSLEPSGIH